MPDDGHHGLASLADNPFVVLTAYFAAFLPWAAFDGADFIGSKWKTVKDTRSQGLSHLCFVLLPIGFIIFYIHLQRISGDYKEMFGAMVALFFSFLHLARTAVGLWQLSKYRFWAAQSIEALAFMGIHFQLKKGRSSDLSPAKPPEEDPMTTADSLLVNEQIVDNQLFHGDARCYLQYGAWSLSMRQQTRTALPMRFSLAYNLLTLPIRWTLDRLRSLIFKVSVPQLHVRPHRPIGLWLVWTASFCAQGLSHWVRDFMVAKESGQNSEDHFSRNHDKYVLWRDYFASEVLASAAFHLLSDGDEEIKCGNPLLWPEWPVSSNISDGRITKDELLSLAVHFGDILPFGAPHYKSLRRTASGSHVGYTPYNGRLNRVCDELPTKFGKDIKNFDSDKLEWLTILLFLGYKAAKREKGKISQTEEEVPPNHILSKRKDLDFDERDLPFENLRGQLGFRDPEDDSKVAEPVTSICTFPFRKSFFKRISGHNRLVLQVGELIDIWLALVSGEQISFLLDKDRKWEMICCGDVQVSSLSVEGTETLGPSDRERTHELREMQGAVEKARLKSEFANKAHRYWHLDQTLTFMGYSMETVRTYLGTRVQNNNDWEEEDWNPSLCFDSDEFVRSTVTVDIPLSADLSHGFLFSGNLDYLHRRGVQVRLIYELQNFLRNAISGETVRDEFAVMLCLISFPSLEFEARFHENRKSATKSRKEFGSHVVLLDCARGTKAASNIISTLEARIRPQCGPQQLEVSVEFSGQEKSLVSAKLRLVRKSGIHDYSFNWQWWKDSFLARLKSKSQWQKKHHMASPHLHVISADITAGVKQIPVQYKGTGDRMLTWSGWPPFRFEICTYELLSRGFLLAYRDMITGEDTLKGRVELDLPNTPRTRRKMREVVFYEDAPREILEHNCLVVREVLGEESRTEDFEALVLSPQERGNRMVREAKGLLKKGARSLDRAVFLCEIAALELGSVEGLQSSIHLLTTGKHVPPRIGRALWILESFIARYSAENTEGKASLPHESKDDNVRVFRSLFEQLMRSHGRRTKVLRSFSKFRDMQTATDMGSYIEDTQTILRETFLSTRNFYIIFELGLSPDPRLHMHFIDAGSSCIHYTPKSGVMSRSFDILPGSRDRITDTNLNKLRNSFFERAIEKERDVEATFELAVMYDKGLRGVLRNPVKAIELYEYTIGENEHIGAMNNLAKILRDGAEGVERDPRRAARLYERSIQRGRNLEAMYNLGILLEVGAGGVRRDVHRATELYEHAIADGEYVPAMHRLANLRLHGGEGVLRDPTGAVQLYQRAIDLEKFPPSIHKLAAVLARGLEGVPMDKARAAGLLSMLSPDEKLKAVL